MRQHIAPLSGGFMIIGIFGFLFAIFFLKNYSLNWAVIVGTISAIAFIASLISTTYAPVEEELALDEHITERKRRVKTYTLKEYKAHQERLKQQHKFELEQLRAQKPKQTVTKKTRRTLVKRKTNKKLSSNKKIVISKKSSFKKTKNKQKSK